jgi:flavin reductase (DIM6/NTAB) family NADH-FMN oxidoreductase RutF
MTIEPIAIDEFSSKLFKAFDKGWFLLTAGSFADKKFNCMTISWGMMGIMWNKPIVQVVVRPTRYTDEFMESSPDFTVCAFPREYRKALSLLGSKSGRDGDKIKESGLTPCPASLVSAPAYAEANLVFECRKIYKDVFKPAGFIEPAILEEYPAKDYHHIYIGEVVAIKGIRS